MPVWLATVSSGLLIRKQGTPSWPKRKSGTAIVCRGRSFQAIQFAEYRSFGLLTMAGMSTISSSGNDEEMTDPMFGRFGTERCAGSLAFRGIRVLLSYL